MLSGLSGGSLAFLAVFRLERSVNNQQIDLACIHIHPTYLHNHPISQLITDTGPFSTQLVTDFVEMVIVIAQIGNMYQSFDKKIVKLDEIPKPVTPEIVPVKCSPSLSRTK